MNGDKIPRRTLLKSGMAATTAAGMMGLHGCSSLKVPGADKPAGAGNELDVMFTPRFRIQPEKIVLHIPPVDGLRRVRLNGRNPGWAREQKFITIAS